MPHFARPERLWPLMRGLALGLLLVAGTTLIVFIIVEKGRVTHGTVVYLVPVVIAAVRWGLIPALFTAALGTVASAFFFFPPIYSFEIRDPQEVVNLLLYVFCAILVSQLASRLKRQLEVSRQREIDLADLYAFSRRLAVAFDVSDIHAAIEDHLAAVMQRKVLLFASGRERARRAGSAAPEPVRRQLAELAAAQQEPDATVVDTNGDAWFVRAVAAKNPDYGMVAVNLGQTSKEGYAALRSRLDHVLADATATLERLGVAQAINEARMRAQTDQLREALIGSVSHELRTPLASILGAATVLSSAPALQKEPRLKDLAQGVRDEAERLNNDIQNLLDATRISSDGVRPHIEWADPADILHSALDRCRNRLTQRKLSLDIPQDLPLVRVDAVLVQQALVQILDNAVKYSGPGSEIKVSIRSKDAHLTLAVADEGAGLTEPERLRMWDRFARGERHVGSINGSGLGLWIAGAFIAANGGTIKASSDGPGRGTLMTIELPVAQTAVPQMEGDADE